MTTIIWDDEAKCELNCSVLYLAKRGGRELGERFLSLVDAAIISASSDPFRHRKLGGMPAKCASSVSLTMSFIGMTKPTAAFTSSL